MAWNEDEATWNNATGVTAWPGPGAAGSSLDNDGLPGSVGWDPNWLDLDVTDSVRGWSNGDANFGWRITPLAGNSNRKQFHSSEWNAEPSLRPKLTIELQLR